MGIALFTLAQWFGPLEALVMGFMSPSSRSLVRRPDAQRRAPSARRPSKRFDARQDCLDLQPRVQPADHELAPRCKAPEAGRPRPLRVVRVSDPRLAAQSAGRMVISGRMADVCAELDRLAEAEARQALRH